MSLGILNFCFGDLEKRRKFIKNILNVRFNIFERSFNFF